MIVGDDPSRTGIEPLGVGEGWVASRHTAGGGARVTNLVLAHGAVEVRAHVVAGAAPGTGVRVTGWTAKGDARAELQPVHGLLDAPTGLTGLTGTATATATGEASLFVALARLTAEPDPVPLAEAVAVRVDGTGELTVTWSGGREVRVRVGDGVAEVRSH